MRCTVIEGGRAERQRRWWIEAGRFKLDVLKPRRLNFLISQRPKLLLDASEHQGFFGRCQTFPFSAPTKMLQRRLHRCYPPPLCPTCSLEQTAAIMAAFVAHLQEARWKVDALCAPHIGERSEKALIASDSPAPTALCGDDRS